MTETLREATNRANPSGLSDILRALAVGDMLTQRLPRVMRAEVPNVADAVLEGAVSVDRIRLPSNCKASRIRQARARASGVGALGLMTITALNTVPGAAEIAIAPNGDIVFLAASAYTSVDVDYEPVIGKVIELTNVPVAPATGICTLLPPIVAMHPHVLVAATITDGVVIGQCTVAYRATAAPAATLFANLDLPGDHVRFLAADGVRMCNLTLIVAGDVEDPQDLLTSENTSNV